MPRPQNGPTLRVNIPDLPYIRKGTSHEFVVYIHGTPAPQTVRVTLSPESGLSFAEHRSSGPGDTHSLHVSCDSVSNTSPGEHFVHSSPVRILATEDAQVEICVTSDSNAFSPVDFVGAPRPEPARPPPPAPPGLHVVKNAPVYEEHDASDDEDTPTVAPPMLLEDDPLNDDGVDVDDESTDRHNTSESEAAPPPPPPLAMPLPPRRGVVRPVDRKPEGVLAAPVRSSSDSVPQPAPAADVASASPSANGDTPPSDDDGHVLNANLPRLDATLGGALPEENRGADFAGEAPAGWSTWSLFGFLAAGFMLTLLIGFAWKHNLHVSSGTSNVALAPQPIHEEPAQVNLPPPVEAPADPPALIVTASSPPAPVKEQAQDDAPVAADAAVPNAPTDPATSGEPDPPSPSMEVVEDMEAPEEPEPVYTQRTCTWIAGGLLSKTPDPDGCVIVGCAEGHAVAMIQQAGNWEYCERYPTESADGSCVQVLTEAGTSTTVQFDPKTKTWPTNGRCSVDR